MIWFSFQRSAVTEQGVTIPEAEIEVRNAGLTSNPDLASDEAGSTLSNPFDADLQGFFRFYIGFGRYDILVNGNLLWEDVQIGRPELNDITDLAGVNTAALMDGQQFYLSSYHPGLGMGGGPFEYDASRPKSDHDGGEVISPTVPVGLDAERWDGTALVAPSDPTLEDYLNGVGETDPGGTGCFVRKIGEAASPDMYGARGVVGSDTWGDAAPIEKSINRKIHGTVYIVQPRHHLERTVQIEARGVTIRGARTGFDTLKTISTMFNVNISSGVSGQLNFYNVFFRNFPEDGTLGDGCVALRAIDFPIIDSTMDSCWFAMGSQNSICILGKFFFFKISNTIMELGHRGIVTQGGSESNALEVANCGFFEMADCIFDFSDATQSKDNFVISNISAKLGTGDNLSAFMRGLNLDAAVSTVSLYIQDDHAFGTAQIVDISGGSDVGINNMNAYNKLGERHESTTHQHWFRVESSTLRLSDSNIESPHQAHIRLRNSAKVLVSNTTFAGSSTNSIQFDTNATDALLELSNCEFARDKSVFFNNATGLSGCEVIMRSVHINDCSYGDGVSSLTARNLIARDGVQTTVIDGRFTKEVSDVFAHVDPSKSITIQGYQVAGPAPLYDPATADYDVFHVLGGLGEVATLVTYGTAPPTSGSWVRGSRRVNIEPSAGGVPEWVCVASGSPGTWKARGSLEA